MADLFPFFGDGIAATEEKEMPLYKEVAWDFENNVPRLKNGEFYIVTGNEALKTWCYKALMTERYRYIIYSTDYGNELEEMIGQSYTPNLTKAESIRFIEECLLINPYIKVVSNLEVRFDGGRLAISGKLETVYGEMEVSF
ncbi:DUF2634 domain-containing protein [Anaerotignum sp. MB30-C6]|uniref:DUF2634 domain-containing protein n=1 Tax=Anaerotignum sp. MB30-C6 TaxID=3070814 RepID=UPI0027DB271C|nr:DUF2634 domain-containing protein [Anaerotignum sp. MB30-C6]WMI81605.1 DUF2634 domain-containing protein [Anaerotignum sp. MB30-C6]